MEEWKPVNDKYEVSDFGRVRNSKTKRVLKERIYDDGYSKVVLYGDNSKQISKTIHRLVVEAFIPIPSDELIQWEISTGNKLQINHIDGDKQNNLASNLEWCTPQENIQHAIKIGLIVKRTGSDNLNSKLTEEQVMMIRKSYVRGSSDSGVKALSKKYKVSISVISNIVNRKKWVHI